MDCYAWEAMDRDLHDIYEAHEVGYHLVPCDGKAGLGRWNLRDYSLGEILFYFRRGLNVAIKMGLSHGTARPVVIDRDTRTMELFRFLQKNKFRSGMEVETASGNWHVYGCLPDDMDDVRTKIKVLELPIDLKLTSLCVFAGSVIGGKPYTTRKNKRVIRPEELPVFDVAKFLEAKRIEAVSGLGLFRHGEPPG